MYQIQLTKQAEKAFDQLMRSQPHFGRRIAQVIDSLSRDPFSGIPLKGNLKGCYKYRVGSYRIIYEIYKQKLMVVVIDMGHRKDVYR